MRKADTPEPRGASAAAHSQRIARRRLVVVRHGARLDVEEPAAWRAAVAAGACEEEDPPLTSAGLRQAAAYGALFDDEPPVVARARAKCIGAAAHSAAQRACAEAVRAREGGEGEGQGGGGPGAEGDGLRVVVHGVDDEGDVGHGPDGRRDEDGDAATLQPSVPETWAAYARRVARTLRAVVRASEPDEDVVCVTHGYGVVVAAFALGHSEVFDVGYCATLIFEEDADSGAFRLVSGDDALLPWHEGKVEHKPAPIRLRA